ncbi:MULTISPECIES: FeGP cofactor biosynthesis protein HcgF family protein [unclassified Methanopyrus]|uniref:FeGP cofactor biosynthesis protein HcgF family protein n=1 Tax=Methanopyrus sp. SNP6 TaxID=1937005 RepID=UPI0011E5FC03|nr:FeGP cofactor biosynthesis protein HcgF family protein [Methanopyrus sp. SNP6]
MIRVATAECFTHGFVGREIHASASGYTGELGSEILGTELEGKVSVVAVCFIPTVSGLRSLLGIDPPEPDEVSKSGAKAYREETDRKVAVMMARAVRERTGADVGIGTTAGIGRGAICLDDGEITLLGRTDVHANLLKPDKRIRKRQLQGIKRSLIVFRAYFRDELDELLEEEWVEEVTLGLP